MSIDKTSVITRIVGDVCAVTGAGISEVFGAGGAPCTLGNSGNVLLSTP
jgi:hypothetical protein